jgi:shikimate dehydrogenase
VSGLWPFFVADLWPAFFCFLFFAFFACLGFHSSMLKLAVIGNPIQHSLSPVIHHAFAAQVGIAVHYQKIEAPLDNFVGTAQAFIAEGATGFNVTVPFKEQAFALATQHSERALQAKAVNTIWVKPDGTLFGDNTDGVGFVRDLGEHKKIALSSATVVIHGAGGATRGILPAILAQKPQRLFLLNRTLIKAQQLAEEFAPLGFIQVLEYGQPATDVDVLIDATSFANENFSGLSALQFSSKSFCYDLKYTKHHQTPILEWAKSQGIKNSSDGFGMLIEQAAEAFFVWTEVRPKTTDLTLIL